MLHKAAVYLCWTPGALWWQPRVGETCLVFHSLAFSLEARAGRAPVRGGGPQAQGALGALGVKGLGGLNSECVKAREIRLRRQTEVMINFSSLHTVSSLSYCCFSL